MKTNVDGANHGAGAWSARAHQEVPELRRAITAHLDEPVTASAMAPMMGELLTRLEGFSHPPKVGDLDAPAPPNGQGSMTQSDAAAALHQACGMLRERVLSGTADGQVAGALQAMVQVIENHLTMKGEVLARSASDTTPG